MRKLFVLSLALTGAVGAVSGAHAAPFVADPSVAEYGRLQPVQFYEGGRHEDWRRHEAHEHWRREHERRRREAWRHEYRGDYR